jgi:beta-glucanase (GH16 family)
MKTELACFLGTAAVLCLHCGSSDDSGPAPAASGGSAGMEAGAEASAGADASAGSGGSAGTAGSAGSAGTSGSGGNAGAAGSAGAGGIAGPMGVGGSWTLVWHDEFDAASLDLAKWHPNWFGADETSITVPVNDLEVSCYDPAQVVVDGGLLQLTAVSSSKPGCKKKDGTAASYASGLVMSDGLYNFTYGFVEARMWLPPGTGTPENWAAFWVTGDTWPQDGEIDIMETLGGGSDTRWTYHYDSDTGSGTVHSQIGAPKNNLISASGWHVFGADWQPDNLTFYYDGVDVGSVASSDLSGGAKVASTPHYFIVNHGLNGDYPVMVPSTLKIDYVRHWQK